MDEIERYNNAWDEVDRLTSEIEDLDRRKSELTNQLEQAEYRAAVALMPALRRAQKTFAVRLPQVKRGPRSKKKPRFRIELKTPVKSGKERRDNMIIEELQRRKDVNPGRAVTSGGKKEASLAFELSEELKQDGYDISYSTIRDIWESGANNQGSF